MCWKRDLDLVIWKSEGKHCLDHFAEREKSHTTFGYTQIQIGTQSLKTNLLSREHFERFLIFLLFIKSYRHNNGGKMKFSVFQMKIAIVDSIFYLKIPCVVKEKKCFNYIFLSFKNYVFYSPTGSDSNIDRTFVKNHFEMCSTRVASKQIKLWTKSLICYDIRWKCALTASNALKLGSKENG